jgi:hypothetical protein
LPWITHRIQHPTANDIIGRGHWTTTIPVAIAEVVPSLAPSPFMEQQVIIGTSFDRGFAFKFAFLRQHLYRFIIPVGRAYRLPETQTDWIDVRES